MNRTARWCRLAGALVVWLSSWCLSGVFEATGCRGSIDIVSTLSNQQPGAILAMLDWGWESRLVDATPTEQQRTADSCGPAALRRVIRNCISASSAVIRSVSASERARIPRQADTTLRTQGMGCTLGEIRRAATQLGLRTRLLVARDLREITPPAILHLHRGHFVVLEDRTGYRVHVFDPAHGVIRTRAARLSEQWSGAVLQFARAEPNRPVVAVLP